MKVSASKIWYESNYTDIVFSRGKNSLTLLFPTMLDWIYKTMNNNDGV